MDVHKIMIIIKGKDCTEKIAAFNRMGNSVAITFIGRQTTYNYSGRNIQIITQPEEVDIQNKIIFINEKKYDNISEILKFGEYYRVITCNNKILFYHKKSVMILEDYCKQENIQKILDYLKEIAQYLPIDGIANGKNMDGVPFLAKRLNKIIAIRPESALYCYLNDQKFDENLKNKSLRIFPFSFNLSQKIAVDNALKNQFSVIEGPPGTGKTQTILNILANLVAVQRKSVAVVSNNNEAVKNIIEKLNKNNYGFLCAMLGNKENQERFFENLPDINVGDWKCNEQNKDLENKLQKLNSELNELMFLEREKLEIKQTVAQWELEEKHFLEYYNKQYNDEPAKMPIYMASSNRIMDFLTEITAAKECGYDDKFLHKLKMLIKFGVYNYKKLTKKEISLFLYLQKKFYEKKITDLYNAIKQIDDKLKNLQFNKIQNENKILSEKLFKKYLYERYININREVFSKQTYKSDFDMFEKFLERYPVILSTTHSLQSSIPDNYLLDYVIIDESSQVDLITGIIALACCRNVIIVGDLKQLSQITDNRIEKIISIYQENDAYNYFHNSILSSVINLFGSKLPRVILREHYRCHPKIIGFCNQKYYDGKLIAFTEKNICDEPLVLYRTSRGNHMRRISQGRDLGKYNQREIDVIAKEVLKDLKYDGDYSNIGVVTPFRKQVNKLKSQIDEDIQCDTVHKYQGHEKDIIIMSTVLDTSADGVRGMEFVDDAQMINVAVSRAVKQFILVTDDKLFFEKGKNLNDLIRYIKYNTLEKSDHNSNIVSVFDLLYGEYSAKLNKLKSKMDTNQRYKSESILKALLDEIFMEERFTQYYYKQNIFLKNLIEHTGQLDVELQKFIDIASVDFVIYRKIDKSCIGIIEVDGVAFHENNLKQLERDRKKDKILEYYKIPLLRLPTNGSGEKEKIENFLENFS